MNKFIHYSYRVIKYVHILYYQMNLHTNVNDMDRWNMIKLLFGVETYLKQDANYMCQT